MYYPSSPLAEIRAAAPTATVTYADGADQAAAAALAHDSDLVIVFATQWAGEAFDVPLTLSDGQDALISSVAAANPRTVVVLETGGPVLLPWLGEVGAVLAAWYPGTAGGEAIADVLSGKVNPSGHLPASFPRSLDQLPHPAPPSAGDVRYVEGAAVGYKWYDKTGQTPLFAFGHGLSYTAFEFSNLTATRRGLHVRAAFTVRNTGARVGKAVPQVYVAGAGWEAPKRLAGFAKVQLAPGASQQVSVDIDPRLLAHWDEPRNVWRIAPGTYRLTLATAANQASFSAGQQVSLTLPELFYRPAAIGSKAK